MKQRTTIHAKSRPQTTRTLNDLFGQYQRGAAKRNLIFELDFDRFSAIMYKCCLYCHKDPGWGVDRRDNQKGYTLENAVPCCSECNLIKGTLTAKEFIDLAHRVTAATPHRLPIQEYFASYQ